MKTFCPFFRFALVDQHLPGGQADQRDRGRLFHAEVLGLQGHVGFIDGDGFGECPDPAIARPRIDFVAGFEFADF